MGGEAKGKMHGLYSMIIFTYKLPVNPKITLSLSIRGF